MNHNHPSYFSKYPVIHRDRIKHIKANPNMYISSSYINTIKILNILDNIGSTKKIQLKEKN